MRLDLEKIGNFGGINAVCIIKRTLYKLPDIICMKGKINPFLLKRLMRNYANFKGYPRVLIVKFILGIVVRIVLEQNLYEMVGKSLLLHFAIRRLLYRFLVQRILWYTIALKTPIWFIQLILFFISRTSRVTIVGEENLKKVEQEKRNLIFALWHGNYTLLLTSLRREKAVALVHSSFRGNYIARLFSTFNYQIVQTSRTGRSVQDLIKAIKQGYSGFITVDGPQGPAYQTKPGIIYVAQKAEATIVPLGLQTRGGFVLRRWDNHVIPLPFTNITVSFGKSIEVKPGDSLQVKGAEVTRSLLELTSGKEGKLDIIEKYNKIQA